MKELDLLKQAQNSGKLTNAQKEEIKGFVLRKIDPDKLEAMGNLKLVRVEGILIGQCPQDFNSFQFTQQFKKLESIEHFKDLIIKKLNKETDDSFESRVQMLEDNKSLSPEDEIKKILTKILSSKYEELSLWEKAVKFSNPNDEGVSQEIFFENLPAELQELQSKNGGTWFRASSAIHNFFEVEILRKSESATSLAIGFRLNGFSEQYRTINNYIPSKVREDHKDKPCVISGKVHSIMEIDHKIGYKEGQQKDDPRLKDSAYFQPMSKTINDAKREHCKSCKISNCRFDARQLGFSFPVTKGSTKLEATPDKKFSHTENPCDGCYWYDPKKFIKEHSSLIKQQGAMSLSDSDLEESLKTKKIEEIFQK